MGASALKLPAASCSESSTSHGPSNCFGSLANPAASCGECARCFGSCCEHRRRNGSSRFFSVPDFVGYNGHESQIKWGEKAARMEISSWGKMDHLSYLERTSLFESDNDDPCETALLCASCGHPVTNVSEKVDIRGRHDHAFSYYRQVVRLGCFRDAPGCRSVQGVSHGYTWFRGYAWQIQVCKNCFTQLGWKYISPDDTFYGLIFGTLREAE
jgi:hypothetical protein